jgi:hypothetical protein
VHLDTDFRTKRCQLVDRLTFKIFVEKLSFGKPFGEISARDPFDVVLNLFGWNLLIEFTSELIPVAQMTPKVDTIGLYLAFRRV